MTAYDASEWTDMFVAAAGASAALAGLIFVAVSINVDRILKLEGVPERAMQALGQLIIVVVISILMLAPGQSSTALGVEATAFGAAAVVGSWLTLRAAVAEAIPRGGLAARSLVVALGTVPFLIGGISLIAESGGGLYWILAGIVLATMGSVVNAWVLLVEILR